MPATVMSTRPEESHLDPSHDIPYSAEVKRKALHLLALIVPFLMGVLGKNLSVAILLPMAVISVGADALRAHSAPFAAWIDRWFGFMMRRDERFVRPDRIIINGASWVIVTALVLAVVFPIRIAVSCFVMFMVADAAAALVGRRFGRYNWPNSPRTLEGSAAFFITGVTIMFLFPDVVFWTGAVTALVGAAAEVVRKPLNDNIRVPVVSAFTLFLLERYVLGLDVALFHF